MWLSGNAAAPFFPARHRAIASRLRYIAEAWEYFAGVNARQNPMADGVLYAPRGNFIVSTRIIGTGRLPVCAQNAASSLSTVPSVQK